MFSLLSGVFVFADAVVDDFDKSTDAFCQLLILQREGEPQRACTGGPNALIRVRRLHRARAAAAIRTGTR